MYLRTFLSILFLYIFVFQNYAQIKNVGLPFISNFDREIYGAQTQNWDIVQDDEGVMYFANNLGVLSFNGSTWQLYPLPNNIIIRSLAFINGKLYAGGFNEFGFFEKNSYGKLEYFSLSDELNIEDFDEIWRIFDTPDGIVFQSYLNVFIYDQGGFKILEPKSKFGFSYQINDQIFIVDREYGLYEIINKKLVPVYLDNHFFIKNEVSFLIELDNKSKLLGTTNSGIFIFSDEKTVPWNKEINKHFLKNQIYTGIELPKNQIAIGTIQNGIYIINKEGELIQQANRLKGLQNNTVLSILYDNNQNLWLGLDNGIALLEVNSPITIFNYSSNIESSYTSIIYKEILYIGTNQGLFAKKLSELNNKNLHLSGFEMIKGTMGQVWKLKVIDNTLFCGHNVGTFIVDGFDAKKISNTPGGWDYIKIPWDNNYIIGGTYSGLQLFEWNNTKQIWESKKQILGYIESSKKLLFDNDKNLWITHGLKGIFRIRLSNDLTEVKEFEIFNNSHGLPELPYAISSIDSKVIIIAGGKLFEYDNNSNRFVKNTHVSDIFHNIPNLTNLIEDSRRDIWYFTNNKFGVFRLLEDGSFTKIDKPFNRIQKLFIGASYENIFSYGNGNTLIGSQEGMIHYLSNEKNYNNSYKTYLNEIKIRRKNTKNSYVDSLESVKFVDLRSSKNIPHKFNSISFKFYTPFYENPNNLQHSYRLIGFDDKWSEWNHITFKEYTNLHEGKYTFEVKALNTHDIESIPYKFEFTVNPPFYRSSIAIILYTFLFLIIAVVIIVYFRLKIEKTRKIENQKLIIKEEEFKKVTELSEQKIERLEKEKHKSELRLKNIELANSTMNLVQKNKLLNRIKNELNTISDKARSTAVKLDIKQLVIKIDKDINNDQNLKVFDKYFDQVHQDFVKRIKEKHPNLTPKDLRLCAYLRMNISTKEIAPLLNVSIRGLEISRYRLRKKLELEHQVNLVDYIMKI